MRPYKWPPSDWESATGPVAAMTELRWILLGLGLLVIGGIYLLWGRGLGTRRESSNSTDHKVEPTLTNGDESFDELISGQAAAGRSVTPPKQSELRAADRDLAPAAAAGADTARSTGESQKIITLHVACRGSQRILGPDLELAMQAENMQLGRFDIYHRLSEDSGATVFSAANMVEPGTFDASKMAELSTPGLSLFLLLPGPIDGAEAFSEMLIAARGLANRLGAEVLDEHGSSLSNQTAGHIREEILAFQLRVRALDEAGA